MLRIGGFQKFSLIDFPGKMAAVIFTQGCDFRCPFCHNPELVLPEKFSDSISEQEVLDFLKKRQGQLNGVAVTGGEPTIQGDLKAFLRKVKDLGFSLKLDTNGNNPEVLDNLIKESLIDYIAMDIKAPLERYSNVTGVQIDQSKIKKSINLILNSGLDYQFRTTVIRKFISSNDLENVRSLLGPVRQYVLQKFDPTSTLLDETLKDARVYNEEEFLALKEKYEKKM
ncbi:MAG: anaerobic ribonucleoside-triphosphate reductase activating protein [Candidatus Omnitrophica bacterium]|nr:anaerobic ribonucleoside-triphosphate reductase activating protein [Candidatus Omnitrophota bacterium]